MSVESPDDFLTVKEVAAHVRVLEKTVREWISQGRLPAAKAGSKLLIRRGDMLAFLGQGETAPTKEPVPEGPFRDTGSRVLRPTRAAVDR